MDHFSGNVSLPPYFSPSLRTWVNPVPADGPGAMHEYARLENVASLRRRFFCTRHVSVCARPSYNGITRASQARDAGSTPVGRLLIQHIRLFPPYRQADSLQKHDLRRFLPNLCPQFCHELHQSPVVHSIMKFVRVPLGARSDTSTELTRAPGGPCESHSLYREMADNGPSA